jgi:hypothetical protein
VRDAVNRALKLPSTIGTMRLIHNQFGQKYRYDAFNSAWERSMAKAVDQEGIQPFRVVA